MRFTDKVLFATGGGSGIAAAVARRFTEEGGRVAVADLDEGRAKAVAAELEGAVGLACDVSDEDSVRAALAPPSSSSAGSTRCSTRVVTPSSGRSRSGRSSAGTG